MTIRGAETTIDTKNFNVGYRGTGTLDMYDGTIKATGYFCVGNDRSYAYGTMNQYGGTVETAWAPLGHNGKGVYNLYDGTLKVTGGNGIQVGNNGGSNFEFNQSGGTVTSTGAVTVGNSGTGTYTMTDGQIISSADVTIGNNQKGAFTMTDGAIHMTGGTLYVGRGSGSNGTFIQNGGDVNPVDATYTGHRNMYIGDGGDSVGSYTMNGGTLTTNDFAVGNYGSGQFTLNDGTVYANGWFLVGFRNGKDFTTPNLATQYGGTLDASWFTLGWEYAYSVGQYDMYGGTLKSRNGNDMIIGNNGVGTFNLYDGDVSTQKNLYIGNSEGSVGTFSMTDGTLTANCISVGHSGSGQFTLKKGDVNVADWFLVGFYRGAGSEKPNLATQYGGNLKAGWLTVGWDNANAVGQYDMYGGTIETTGRNPLILGNNGTGTFNLYEGTVTIAQNVDGNALQLGNGTGKLNIYSGTMTANGNASVNAASSIHFGSSVLGTGKLTVNGSFTQAEGGKVTVKLADGVSFFDNYSAANGVDVLTVTGDASDLKVDNLSKDLIDVTSTAAADGGKVNVKLASSQNKGNINANIGELIFVAAKSGWVGLSDFGGTDPYVFRMSVDTGDMSMDKFLDQLNTDMKVGDKMFVEAKYDAENDQVFMTVMPDLMDIDAFSWNFTNTERYLGDVAVTGFQSNAVPEPAAWLLLGLGLTTVFVLRKKKK